MASNKTSEGRGRNRRVDIIVLPTLHHPILEMAGTNEKQIPEFLSKAVRTTLAGNPSGKAPWSTSDTRKRLMLAAQNLSFHLQHTGQASSSKVRLDAGPSQSGVPTGPKK